MLHTNQPLFNAEKWPVQGDPSAHTRSKKLLHPNVIYINLYEYSLQSSKDLSLSLFLLYFDGLRTNGSGALFSNQLSFAKAPRRVIVYTADEPLLR